jgi:hypothetical protein
MVTEVEVKVDDATTCCIKGISISKILLFTTCSSPLLLRRLDAKSPDCYTTQSGLTTDGSEGVTMSALRFRLQQALWRSTPNAQIASSTGVRSVKYNYQVTDFGFE